MRGKTLQDLAIEIERQATSKRDFIAPAKAIAMELQQSSLSENENGAGMPISVPQLAVQNGQKLQFVIKDTAHEQIAARLDIPKTYYDRMRTEAPALLAGNVNHWFQRSDKKFMLRTLDGNARALLSDRYRPLDNYDLAEAVMPILSDHKWTIRDCDLTERKLYIKIVSTDLQADIKYRHGFAHVVHPGLTISNSEIGGGAVRVTPSLHWPHCYNIAMMDGMATSRFHTGRRDERFGDIAAEFFRDETREQDDRAFWMKVRDVVRATLTEGIFKAMVEKFEQAAQARIEGDVTKVVELTAKRYGLKDVERTSVLKYLIEGGDLSLYGLSGAITRAAQDDAVDYDRGTELEKFGGDVIELNRSQWMELQYAT